MLQRWVQQKCGCDITAVEAEMERLQQLAYPHLSEHNEALLQHASSEDVQISRSPSPSEA